MNPIPELVYYAALRTRVQQSQEDDLFIVRGYANQQGWPDTVGIHEAALRVLEIAIARGVGVVCRG